MKTKLIILMAAAAAVLYSCSNDRDEEARMEAIEKVKTSKPELKLNPLGRGLDENTESSVVRDTIQRIETPSATPPTTMTPEDGGDPKDVPPRK